MRPPESGRPGVGGQLLLQSQPGRQPVRQGMIKLRGQADLGQQAGDEVAPANMGQLVSEHGPPLGVVPGVPVRGQKNERTTPADRGRRGQLGRGANLDGLRATHLGPEEGQGVDQVRSGERRAA